jgi:hypothetical protein
MHRCLLCPLVEGIRCSEKDISAYGRMRWKVRKGKLTKVKNKKL